MFRISACAPTRVDLAGGTIDLWPIHQILSHKATVNLGVNLDAQVEVVASSDNQYRFISQDQQVSIVGNFDKVSHSHELPLIGLILSNLWDSSLPAVTISTAAKSPAGAGLGGSSCLAVTLAGALLEAKRVLRKGEFIDENTLVRIVRDIEAKIIHCPTGVQDYWGAVRGGINILRYPPGAVKVETLPPSSCPKISEELILCYSGKSRQSAMNNWEIFKKVFDGNKQVIEIFNEIGKAAESCAEAIKEGDLFRCLHYSELEWRLRIQLWPDIETQETKRLDDAARKAGARFTRVCGAGGGGVMVVFAPVEKHKLVKSALMANGGIILNAGVATAGLAVKSNLGD